MDKFQASMVLFWIEKNLVDTDNPRQYGKKFVTNRNDEWRYRVGDCRIIADINDETSTILILEIGHRHSIDRSSTKP